MGKNYATFFEEVMSSLEIITSLFSRNYIFQQKTKIQLIPVTVFMLFFYSNIFAQFPGADNTAGIGKTYNIPANVTSVKAEVWGSGGSGGGSNSNGNSGSGAGGGGYTTKTFAVTAGDLITYTVGAGAAAGVVGANGNNGNLSSLAHIPTATNLTGNAGSRGNANSGTGGTGGTGAGGTTNTTGATGGAGATATGGNGGDGGNAAGTGGAGQTNVNGLAGTIPGGGGGGGEFGGGSSRAGGAGANGQVTLTFISVSSVTPNPVCTGSTITITGTNFASGASTVSINGTACTSVTWVNATTITAVVAAGTTSGVVLVTNPNGTNNGKSVTVNPSPTITSQPTATSICNSAGTGTFTVTATGAITGYQWRRNGVNLTNSAPYSGVTTNTLTITNPALAIAGNFDVVISTAAPCSTTSNVAVLTVTDVPPIATTPSPANSATGICYAGSGSISSVSWTAVATATSYDVYFGAGSLPGSVTSNVATNSYNTGALAANTTYYWKVVAKNSCGSAVGSSTWTFTTSAAPCYCTSSGGTVADGISGVNFNTINNLGTVVNVAYTDYTAISTNIFKTLSYNLNVYINTGGNYTNYQSVYIDWNGNGSFADAGEFYSLGTATNVVNGLTSLSPLSITVPAGAITGPVRMRIQSRYSAATTSSCQTGFDGEVEDYTLNILNPAACTTPTAQPTALVLTTPAGGTTINGTFTAASPAPDNYLVVISTSATAPTPVNGTTYTIGGTVETGGYLAVDTDGNTSFSATGLTPATQYYVYVFSYNSLCTGGPLYNTTAPLNGNATTTSVAAGAYCTPSTTNTASSLYIKDVAFLGTLQDVSNYNNSYSAVTPGYQDFTALPTKSRQAQGEGINVYVGGANASTANRGHWKAWIDWNKDGVFTDPGEKVYDSGSVATSTTTFGFVIPSTTAPGNYRIRIRFYNLYKINNPGAGSEGAYSYNFDSCEVFDIDGSSAYREYGEAEDYLFTVDASCAAIIKTVTGGSTCGTGPVTLSATGSVGTTSYHWYTTLTGGSPIAGATSSSYTTPAISSTQTYYVTADNGSCESKVRTAVVAKYNPIPVLSFTPTTPQVCGENTVIALTASGDIETVHLVNENFESGGLGTLTNVNLVNNGATINAKTAWQNRTSTFVPAESVWFPAISSGFGKNKFAMSTSDVAYTVSEALTSAVVNTNTFLNLTLDFNIYYSSYLDGTDPTNDYINVQANDGTGWTTVATYTTDIGIGTKFDFKSISLNAYINKPTLQIRILYHGVFVDGAAVDNVDLYGDRPLSTAFNWTGASLPDAYSDAACTVPYVAGTPAVTVYVKPTLTQLEQGSYTFTASATLSNGCSASTPITVTNKSRVWKGSSSTNWNDPNNWLPVGVPDATNCVIIPANSIISGSGYNAYGKNLTVKNTGNLDLQSSNNLTISDWISVEGAGVFNVRNTANLVQINNNANTGNIRMARTANIRKLDYVYWSSPVANFSSAAVSPGTTGYIYKWVPTIGANLNGWGTWTTGSETMVLGKGYIVRGPDAFTSAFQNYTATFVGVPNNGNITSPISRGTYNGAPYVSGSGSTTMATMDDDNWNLLGNPYPSAINPTSFLAANTNIAGYVKIWTHGTLPSGAILDPYYNDYISNYTSADYITYNGSGSTAGPGVNNIAAGQGFFTLMNNSSAATTETVSFTNSMRQDGSGNAYSNNQFYKVPTGSGNETIEPEKNRIWLDLVSPTNKNIRTLLGYINEATNEEDRLYDAKTDGKLAFNFYSMIHEEPQSIQGRQLPFDQNDMVDFGYKTNESGFHTIAIAATDGVFDKKKIYLEDKEMNIIHDLSKSPYVFTANAGVNNSRFRVRFTNKNSQIANSSVFNETKIFASNSINISSSIKKINSIYVYDISGKKLFEKENLRENEFVVTQIKKSNAILIVKMVLEDNEIVTEKIPF